MADLERIKITEWSDGITLRLKPRKNWFAICYMPIFLTAWTVGGISLINAASKGDETQHVIAIIWACFGVVIATVVMFALLWNIFGEEVISIRSSLFTRKLAVKGAGLKKTYPANEVFNIRTPIFPDDAFMRRNDRGWWLLGMAEETVAVNISYTMLFKFGIRLNEDEAASVVKALRPYINDTSNNSFNWSAS
jgi:hypothetical protein